MSSARRLPATLLPVVLAAAALAGCASEPVRAAPSPTSSPVATPSPTPTPTLAALPSSRVAVTCDQLGAPELVNAVLGGPAVAVAPPVVPVDYALTDRQWGVLSCAWSLGPTDATDGGPLVLVEVVPDVGAKLWADVVPVLGTGGIDAEHPYGPDSYKSCDGSRVLICGLDVLLPNGYWLHASAMHPYDGGAAMPIAPLFDPMVQAVADLGAPRPPWHPAALADYPAQPTCDELVSPEEVSAASGVLVAGAEHAGPTTQLGTHYAAAAGVGMRTCNWYWYDESATGGQGATVKAQVTRIPGGSWAFEELRAAGGRTLTTAVGDAILVDGTENDIPIMTLYQVSGTDLVIAESPGWHGRDASTEALLLDLGTAAAS